MPGMLFAEDHPMSPTCHPRAPVIPRGFLFHFIPAFAPGCFRVLLGLVSVICVLGGFLALGVDHPERKKATMMNQVSLSASFSVTGKQLEGRYTVKNLSPTDVYILDVDMKAESDGGFSVHPSLPDVGFAAPDVVVLLHKLRPLDPTWSWTTAPRALASLLRSGQSGRGVVSLPLPLRQASPPRKYVATKLPDGTPGPAVLAPPASKPREVTCRRVRFVLGVIPSTPALEPREGKAPDGSIVWSLADAAWGLQQDLTVESEVSPGVGVIVNE